MPFLEKHQCHMDFQKSVVVMAGEELVCVDKFGRPLVGGVQVVRDCTVPGRSQVTLCCRVNCRVNCVRSLNLGVVEGTHGAIRLANSLNRLDCRRELPCSASTPSRNLSDYRPERWWGSTTPSTSLLPAQLIKDGATAATTQPLRGALARLGKEPRTPGSQIGEKTRPTHPQLPRHRQSVAPPYRECVLDSAIQAWSRILDRCTEEIESLVHHLKCLNRTIRSGRH